MCILTGAKAPVTWAQVARELHQLVGAEPDAVNPVSTSEFLTGADRAIAPRPSHSVLALAKPEATGFSPRPWSKSLARIPSATLHSDTVEIEANLTVNP